MRIISGARKGKLLHTLEGLDTRPMPDMAKGAIFNIIRPRVANARVLDVFSGTGTLGLEALSVGSQAVSFCEANPAAVSLLKRNLHAIQATAKATVLAGPAGRSARQLKTQAAAFDIIFCDPPFVWMKNLHATMQDDTVSMAELLVTLRELLVDGGLLVVRYESGDAIEAQAGFVPLSDRNPARRYGRSTVAFMVKTAVAGARFEFPAEEDFRGHRPKNMAANVARRAGEKVRSEDDGEDVEDAAGAPTE